MHLAGDQLRRYGIHPHPVSWYGAGSSILSHRGRGGRPVQTEYKGNNKIGPVGFRGNLTRIGVGDVDWGGRRSDLVAALGGH